MKVYGDVDGARIYSVIFTGFSLAAIVQFMFHFVIVKSIGMSYVNIIKLIFRRYWLHLLLPYLWNITHCCSSFVL